MSSNQYDDIDWYKTALLAAAIIGLGLGASGIVATLMAMMLVAVGVLSGGMLVVLAMAPLLMLFAMMTVASYWYLVAPLEE